MKRTMVLVLAAMMLLALCACGQQSIRGTITTEESAPVSTSVEPEHVEQPAEPEPETQVHLGTVEGNVYENSYIGLGYRLNDGWVFHDEDMIKELNNFALDAMEDDLREKVENADILIDLYASDPKVFNNININLEKVNPITLATIDISDQYIHEWDSLKASFENIGYQNLQYDGISINVDGKTLDAIRITSDLSGIPVCMVQFQKKCYSHLATVTVTTYYEDTTQEVLDRLYWLK